MPDKFLREIDISVRTYNCMYRHGIKTIGELREMSDEQLLRVRNLSQKCGDEIKTILLMYPKE
jgi:DNA-directed RNA polymerase subunit alpha